MKEMRFFYVPDATECNEMPMDEALHALRVLRLKSGDEMFLMDGKGTYYRAHVTIAATKRCMYEIDEALPQEKAWRGHIHIAIAPSMMMDRIEWFCEKATEIGIDEIEEVLKEVISKEDVEEKYIRDFLNCGIIDRNSDAIPIDKIMFIYKYGSKKAKKIAVDEKLKMI